MPSIDQNESSDSLPDFRKLGVAVRILLLANPYHPDYQHRTGNRMALANIRERLALHFDVEATLVTEVVADTFSIHIVLRYRRRG